MDIQNSLGNTGRRMDEAWRRAISEGMKRAKSGFDGVKELGAVGLTKVVRTSEGRTKLFDTLNGARRGVTGMLPFSIGAGPGFIAGGALGGALNKRRLANGNLHKNIDKASAAKSLATGRPVVMANKGVAAVGVKAGARLGLGLASRIVPAFMVGNAIGGAIAGAVRGGQGGASDNAGVEQLVRNRSIRKASEARAKRQG